MYFPEQLHDSVTLKFRHVIVDGQRHNIVGRGLGMRQGKLPPRPIYAHMMAWWAVVLADERISFSKAAATSSRFRPNFSLSMMTGRYSQIGS